MWIPGIRHDDGTVSYGASNLRYIWLAECDLMAQLAGMTLERRLADWTGEHQRVLPLICVIR